MPALIFRQSLWRREERQRLLDGWQTTAYIDDYSGIRIARVGQRFRIERAAVWNPGDRR
ncbi:MAG: MEKHLA domain-containing protein [Rhodoferax sp.]|nr:MEKHLA domain-containing protein [Rhodoferax sp.]